MNRRRIAAVLLLLLWPVLASASGQDAPSPEAEVLWDTWNVPHVHADTDVGLAYGFGWAQARSHGDLILRLYAQARGRAAEVLGESMLPSDREVRTFGIPERAQAWYEAQHAPFRQYLDAFAAGVNAYVEAHPERISEPLATVLPITGADLLAHGQRVVHFTFLDPGLTQGPIDELWHGQRAGSNGWAIAPEHAAGEDAMLLGNPHLPWQDAFLFFEAQLVAPDFEFYGATLVGMPVLALGFNAHLGWTHTVNTIDAADLYELDLVGDGYRFDGTVRPFERDEQLVQVRRPDGSLRDVEHVVQRSVHGPVVARDGDRALALRVAGLDRPHAFQQWWNLAHARGLEEFEQELARLQLPLFNVIYADAEGNVMQAFNGLVPRREFGDWSFWRGVVPGDRSETLWHDYLSYEELPRLANPPSGWLQNANEPPWFMTLPYPLEPADYPPYLAPEGMQAGRELRPQRSLRMLLENDAMTFEDMVDAKFSNRSELADRLVGDLVAAARASGRELAADAAAVLTRWDRRFEHDSRGAALFHRWFVGYVEQLRNEALEQASDVNEAVAGAMAAPARIYARPWTWHAAPLEAPDGLAEPERAVRQLEAAASQLRASAGALDVRWGEVARMRADGLELPATSSDGSMGVFQVASPAPAGDGTMRVVGGDAFVFAVAFSDPPRARALLTYGNASQPDVPEGGRQLASYALDELRPVWRTRDQVEANLRRRDVLD